MRETIRKAKNNSGTLDELDDMAWSDPFVRDVYFGGELFSELKNERFARKMKTVREQFIANPPAI